MSTITIKKGDTARAITDVLKLNGSPIDLTDATVKLVWKVDGYTSKKTAAITDAIAGAVTYNITKADVAKACTVQLEWEITFSDLSTLTVPTVGHIELYISSSLA